MNSRVLTKGLVIHISVSIYSKWCCVQEIKWNTYLYKLKYVTTLEKGVVRASNDLDLIISASDDLFWKKYVDLRIEALEG